MVVIEAMACGLPVIATDNGALPNRVVDGQTGYIVPNDGLTAILTARIQQLCDDTALRARMSQNARQLILARYTHAHMINKYLALYGVPKESA